jgi:hypothetical protein
MEFSQIVSSALLIWLVIPVALIIFLLKTPFVKGWIGEFIINVISTFFLRKGEYHVLKNVTLPAVGGTTQIDQIIVSEYGIFVVEIKNMKGWIFGGQQQKTWTQQIYKNKKQFQNPLHQNYKHIKTLENSLNIEGGNIFSVIVFAGDSTFKTSMPDNVRYPMGYIKYIKSKKEKLFSEQEVKKIIDQINSGKLQTSFKTHRQHIEHVKSIVNEKKINEDKVCPKCGNQMVLKTAKKGKYKGQQFWGCKNFPKCREIININE